MNTCNVNKYINTRYNRLMTITDIDMIMHKKSKNHIRIVESKYPKEPDNTSQDDVLKEIAKIFDFAIKNGYKNEKGTPTLEVLKLVCEPHLISNVEHQYRKDTKQEVYKVNSMKTVSYLDGSEKFLQTQDEIEEFVLMEKNAQNKYNRYYETFYKQYELF